MTAIYCEGKEIDFCCEECGEHRLEEIMIDVTVASRVESIGEGGDVEYGVQTNEDGEVSRYQCENCGHVLPFTSSEDLYKYLISKRS